MWLKKQKSEEKKRKEKKRKEKKTHSRVRQAAARL